MYFKGLHTTMSLPAVLNYLLNTISACMLVYHATGYLHTAHAELYDQVTLVDNLMLTYNREMRPVKNVSTVVVVEFWFFLANVLDMNERDQTLTCGTWLTLTWTDEFLMWDPKQYHGLKKIKIPSSTIWLPDIYFYNNALPTYDNFLNGTIVKIEYTGAIQWAAPVNFKGQCLLDTKYFPFDRQLCEMKFGPWQHDVDELVVVGAGETSVFESNGEWDMVGLSQCNKMEYYPDSVKPKTDVTFQIIFSRRAQYYMFNLMMPSLLITLLASLAFLLPPQSQGKVNLGVTFLLSMTVFLKIVAENIPPTNTVPVIGQFFACSMLLVSMSLVLNAVVVTVFSKGHSGEPVPMWLRTFTIHILAPIVRVKTGDITKSGPRSRKRVKNKNKSRGFFSSSSEIEFERVPNGSTSDKSFMEFTPNTGMNRLESVAMELRRVNNILASVGTSHMQGTVPKTPEEKQNEKAWVVTARVLDRAFLILYLIGNALSLLMFLFQILHIGVPDIEDRLCHDKY